MTERVAHVTTAAGRFAFLASGPDDGPLVLCLHGFPDGARTFDGLRAALAAEGYRAVAPWIRGYHPSTTEGPFDADRLGDDALALAEALAPGRAAHLVGHDWGAVATYVALGRAPTRFGPSVALAVPHPLAFLRNAPRSPAQLRRSRYMAFFQLRGVAERALAARDWAYVEALWREWSPRLEPPSPLLEAVKTSLAASRGAPLAHYRANMWPLGAALRRIRAADAVDRRIRTPLLQLLGAADGCIAPDMARGQERHFTPGALVSEVLPDVGHFLHLEAPDAVARRTLDHLRRA